MKIHYKGRLVGEIKRRGDSHVYITHRKKEHYCIKYSGWGITKYVLDWLVEHRIKYVEVVFHHKNGAVRRYQTRTENFLEYGIQDRLGEFELQVFLNERYWKEMKAPEYRKVGWYV